MKIDITSVRNILDIPSTTNDNSIAYLINHYFEYLIEIMNLETSMFQEDIYADVIEDSYTNNDLFLNSELTLLQGTLILGIACDLYNIGIVTRELTDDEYNYFIANIDTSELQKVGEIYLLDWCHIYEECKKLLKNDTYDESTVEYVRRYLGLDPAVIPDSQIEFLIDHYTNILSDKFPDIDTTSQQFKEVVMLGVACQLFKTHPSSIIEPRAYEVGDVSEEFNNAFTKYDDTWCDLYDNALNDLAASVRGGRGVRAFNRASARDKYGFYGPQ